jgi:MtN3 and saliva related transmembrane protein
MGSPRPARQRVPARCPTGFGRPDAATPPPSTAETERAVAAASCGTDGIAPLLQVRRMLQQRSSRDVSIGYYVILLVGFALWIAYGVASNNLALIVPNIVALTVGSAVVLVARRLRVTRPSDRRVPDAPSRS